MRLKVVCQPAYAVIQAAIKKSAMADIMVKKTELCKKLVQNLVWWASSPNHVRIMLIRPIPMAPRVGFCDRKTRYIDSYPAFSIGMLKFIAFLIYLPEDGLFSTAAETSAGFSSFILSAITRYGVSVLFNVLASSLYSRLFEAACRERIY